MSRLQVDAPILRLPFDVWDVIVRSIDYDDWIFESSLDHALRRRRDVARLRVTCVCLRELLESEEFYDTCTNWGGPHSSFPTFRGYTATARPTFDPDVCGRWISRLNRRPHLRGRVSTVTMTDWACHSFFSRVGHHAVHQALLTRFWLEVPKFVQLNALHLFSVAIASEAHRTIRNLATLRHLDLQQCTIWHIDLAEYRSTPALAVETLRILDVDWIHHILLPQYASFTNPSRLVHVETSSIELLKELALPFGPSPTELPLTSLLVRHDCTHSNISMRGLGELVVNKILRRCPKLLRFAVPYRWSVPVTGVFSPSLREFHGSFDWAAHEVRFFQDIEVLCIDTFQSVPFSDHIYDGAASLAEAWELSPAAQVLHTFMLDTWSFVNSVIPTVVTAEIDAVRVLHLLVPMLRRVHYLRLDVASASNSAKALFSALIGHSQNLPELRELTLRCWGVDNPLEERKELDRLAPSTLKLMRRQCPHLQAIRASHGRRWDRTE